jgi:opacity protein-like surface antigen
VSSPGVFADAGTSVAELRQIRDMKRKLNMRRIGTIILGFAFLFVVSALAEDTRSEVNLEGTGFFTKDSNNHGISQRATNTGGFLVGYRYHFNDWLAAEADYGYARDTQKYFASTGFSQVQSNIHEATAAVVVTPPLRVMNLKPFLLAGSGALVFDPRNASIAGAQRQAKAAFVYGGGVDYDLTQHLALRAEYRGLVYKTPDFNLAGLNADKVTHTAQPSAGIVIRF